MNHIILVFKKKDLHKAICTNSKYGAKLSVLNLSREQLLTIKAGSFQFIEAQELVQGKSDHFLKDYRDLMGKLSTNIDSHLWHSTCLASKNRFSTITPILLQQIEACTQAISSLSGRLIIYKPNLSLISTIENICVNYGIQLSYQKYSVRLIIYLDRYKACKGHIKSFLQLMYRLVIIRLFYTLEFKNSLRGKFTVIKSFFYESSIGEKDFDCYQDPMFGRLPSYISNHNNLLIITHILGKYKQCINKINQHQKFTIIPVEYWLTTKSIISSFMQLFFCQMEKKIPQKIDYRGINVTGIFYSELYRKFNDIPFNQLVFYPLMKNCFSSIQISKYIHTYENNPWEKMALMGIREVSPKTISIGFQHAVVPKASVNMFLSRIDMDSNYLPDKVLCVGGEPLGIINKFSKSHQLITEACCGLRYEYLQTMKIKSRRRIRRILIVPEGVPDVISMLNYVLNQLEETKYQFTFRFHPSMSYEHIKTQYQFNIDSIINASISNASLQEDLKDHDLCIYWGSTVSLEALSMGIPLIHYDMQTILSYDPLFRCKALKWSVTDKDSLVSVIKEIESLIDNEYGKQVLLASKYIENYFFPVSDESMEKFLIPN